MLARKKIAYSLALLSTVATLTGCLEDMGVTRFTSKPTAVVSGLSFTDKNMGEMLGGNLVITPAVDGQTEYDKWTFDSYIVKWAIDGVPMAMDMFSASNFVGRVDRTENPLVLPIRAVPPNGVNGFIVYTANALGTADQGQWIPFENIQIDPRVPNASVMPAAVQYGQGYGQRTGNNQGDRDTTVRTEAILSFFKPDPYQACSFGCPTVTNTEQDITEYNVYLAGADGCPLKGAPVAKIPKNSQGFYVQSFGYGRNIVVPPVDANSFVVIPANQYGEAYSETCQYAHTTSNINIITPSKYPNYTSAGIAWSADSDSSDSVSSTLTIKKSADERDLSTGYYLMWGFKGTYSAQDIKYFPKDGNNHTFNFDHWQPTASDGTPYNLDNINVYVSTGYNYLGGDKGITIDMAEKNNRGNWYLINELAMMAAETSDQCITAVDKDKDIKKATCNRFDSAQQFEVEYANYAGNDDFHYIKSVKFPGYCLYRADDAGAPNWQLRTCDKSWNVRTEIKANNQTAADRMKKRIAVNHDAGWTCLAHYTVTKDLSSPWGNCGIVTSEVYWKFLKLGRPTDYGYFND